MRALTSARDCHQNILQKPQRFAFVQQYGSAPANTAGHRDIRMCADIGQMRRQEFTYATCSLHVNWTNAAARNQYASIPISAANAHSHGVAELIQADQSNSCSKRSAPFTKRRTGDKNKVSTDRVRKKATYCCVCALLVSPVVTMARNDTRLATVVDIALHTSSNNFQCYS
jgi:hypothetical protein